MNKKRIIISLIVISLLSPLVNVKPVQAAEPQNGICNGPDEVMTILVIGTDTRGVGYFKGLADTTMLFRVDFQNQVVSVMGFPRDLWVEIPDVEEADRTHGKLTQAYFYGTESMDFYDGPGYGAGLMMATFQQNWGIEIDHYIVINMRVFRDVIDAVGGLKIYNPSPIYSSHNSNKPALLAGGYFFSGKDALSYARYRNPLNVYDRVDRHEIVLKALFEQIFSISVIPKIPELIGLYKGNVLTDMHLAEISQFLCLAAKMEENAIQFTRVPKDTLYIPDWEGFVWLEKEPGSIKLLLDEFMAGIDLEEFPE